MCVCVCKREREREREGQGERERGGGKREGGGGGEREREGERERGSQSLHISLSPRYIRGAVMTKVRWVGKQVMVMNTFLAMLRSSVGLKSSRCLEETVTQLLWPRTEMSIAGVYSG